MTDLDYIKKFSKISVAQVCKDLNINKSNVWSGNASAEKIKKVREEIEKRIEKIKEDS